MKSSKCLFALLVLLAVSTLTGCAGIMSKIPTQDELHGIRGMSKEAVLQKLGPPSDKSSDGNIWYYKKPTNNAINNIVLISSFGLLNGKNSVYMDVARISFRGGKVHSTQTMDDTLDFNLSQMGLARDVVSDLDVPYQRDSNGSSEMSTAKSLIGGVASKIGLSSLMPSGFDSASSSKEEESEQNPIGHEPQPSHSNNKTIRQVNLFPECSLEDAKKRICDNARKLGFVTKQKDGKVSISRDGTNVASSFKQVGKDVVVELSSTGRLHDSFSKDLCKAVEKCN